MSAYILKKAWSKYVDFYRQRATHQIEEGYESEFYLKCCRKLASGQFFETSVSVNLEYHPQIVNLNVASTGALSFSTVHLVGD